MKTLLFAIAHTVIGFIFASILILLTEGLFAPLMIGNLEVYTIVGLYIVYFLIYLLVFCAGALSILLLDSKNKK